MVTILDRPCVRQRGRTTYWTMVRYFSGTKVVVRAEHVKRIAAWLVVCYVGGAVFDARMSDDAQETAEQMISEAAIEYAEAQVPSPRGTGTRRLATHGRSMTGLITACFVLLLGVHSIPSTAVDDVVIELTHPRNWHSHYWNT